MNSTALLVMDMQMGILGGFDGASAVLQKIKTAIDKARSAAIPVIYVRVGFREGAPEISPDNLNFGALKEKLAQVDMQQFIQIHPDVAPADGEVIITKKRFSAFTGSDLEVVLRGLQVNHLVLSGVITSGVVLSTLREAADKDYKLTVLSDGCADRDAEVHRVLTEKVFPKQAKVLTVNEWL